MSRCKIYLHRLCEVLEFRSQFSSVASLFAEELTNLHTLRVEEPAFFSCLCEDQIVVILFVPKRAITSRNHPQSDSFGESQQVPRPTGDGLVFLEADLLEGTVRFQADNTFARKSLECISRSGELLDVVLFGVVDGAFRTQVPTQEGTFHSD